MIRPISIVRYERLYLASFVIVLAVLSAIGVAISLVQSATGRAVPSTTFGLSIVASMVSAAAALQLLKPDAKRWFDQAGRGHAA